MGEYAVSATSPRAGGGDSERLSPAGIIRAACTHNDMSLTVGTRLGPYAITAQIGAGGMGEVYRATDTTLKRDVAVKVLPAALASDPDRIAGVPGGSPPQRAGVRVPRVVEAGL